MPFTFAHPAIVLPFIRWRYVSATGLIAGSVAPDFEYFFKMSVDGVHSHTIAGLFYFNIPVGLLLSLAFHQLVKHAFIGNLSLFWQKRLQDTLHMEFISHLKLHPFIVISSILIGAASHIFWDNFTHGGGYFVNKLWFYQGSHISFDGVNYPLFYAFQYISTVIGLIIVFCYVIFKRPEKLPERSKAWKKYWVYFLLLSGFILGLRFWIYSADFALGNFIVTSISATLLALVILGYLYNKKIVFKS